MKCEVCTLEGHFIQDCPDIHLSKNMKK
jgi:hypothetical protein